MRLIHRVESGPTSGSRVVIGELDQRFADLGAFRGQSVNLTGGDAPDRLVGAFVDASFLRVMGAKLTRGRLFSDAETEVATKAPVAIVSYEAWVTRFGPCPAPLETPEPFATGTNGPATADALARELREAVFQVITAARGPGGAASCPAGARSALR